ncbi:MAG: glycosyltransferase, partial [Duncaniella sp.]|nr:glycosyltransferase [Duncaniella sp.]
MDRPRFSIIVPVYNRIDEVRDLMESLDKQSFKNFEAIFVEDGSTQPCESVLAEFPNVNARYYYKFNEVRSIASNYGMERALG